MKILVTGAAGFIGSHLCQRLVGSDHEVLGIDNFDPFYPRSVKEANVKPMLGSPGFELEEIDVLDLPRLEDRTRAFRPDVVVHLAALAGVQPSLQAPLRFQRVNVEGTMNVLSACLASGCGKLVFASSSSVYGNSSRIPFGEEDPCDRPVSPYAATKRSAELFCYNHHHLHGTEIACLRFFTVYGPRQRPEMAIAKFTRQVASGEEVLIYGDGSSARDYTFITDIVAGAKAAVENKLPGFRIYNLGGSRMITLVDLIDAIQQKLGRKAKIRFEPERAGDVELTYARVDRAERDLSYAPSVSIEEGIGRYVDWCRKQGLVR